MVALRSYWEDEPLKGWAESRLSFVISLGHKGSLSNDMSAFNLAGRDRLAIARAFTDCGGACSG